MQLKQRVLVLSYPKILRNFCLFCLVWSFHTISANENLPANIGEKYQLTVVTENWYPFNYRDKKGEITGSSTEKVKSTLEHANIPFEINLYSWDRAYSFARTQENTLIYSIFRSPIREDMFHWVCPLSSNNIHSVYKLSTRDDIKINTKEDLLNYSMNVTRGTFPHEHFLGQGMKEGVNLQLTATNDANLLMLLKKRVDLIIEVESAIYQMVNDRGLSETVIEKVYTSEEMNQVQSCMAISKGTPQHIIDKIKQSHKALYLD